MAVLEHLVFLGELHGLKRADAAARARRWLERLELAEWAKKKVEELSKGMQQKIQLAGTVLHEPEVLILDEPFSGLDPINQQLFKEAFAALPRRGQDPPLLDPRHGAGREAVRPHLPDLPRPGGARRRAAGDQARLGGNSYRLVAEGDLERLRELRGVEQVLIADGTAKVLLRGDAEGADLLHQAVAFLRVKEFRSEEPELEEIFVKAVRDAN